MSRSKIFSCIAFLLTCGNLLAQTSEPSLYQKNLLRTKTDKTFNVWESQVNKRAIVTLKDGKMILDMASVKDYENFRGLDTLLASLRDDIAFYHDSLEALGGGSVRIDYAVSPEYSYRQLRFIKYPTTGDLFIRKGSDVSKLKLEQDTVRIIIDKILYKSMCSIPYKIQATFILDKYSDIDKIIADRERLHQIIDTLEQSSHSEKEDPKHPFTYMTEMTLLYNPFYAGKPALTKLKGIVTDKFLPGTGLPGRRDYLTFDGNIGIGLTLNTLTPTADIGIAFNRDWGKGVRNTSFIKLYASSYFFFDRYADGNLKVNDNWFVNTSFGSHYGRKNSDWPEITELGFGYLFAPRGNYFKNTTVKVFTEIKLLNSLTVCPELISTNNFKQIFPGATFKMFFSGQ